jgi:hypothetical protein
MIMVKVLSHLFCIFFAFLFNNLQGDKTGIRNTVAITEPHVWINNYTSRHANAPATLLGLHASLNGL